MMKKISSFLVFVLLMSCSKDEDLKNPLFGKWELKRVEQKMSRINHLDKLVTENNNYVIEPFCDAKLSEFLGRPLDDIPFCNIEDIADCITYVDDQEFIEIGDQEFKYREIEHSEDFYSETTRRHVGHGLRNSGDCLIKVIENSRSVKSGSYQLNEDTKTFIVDFKSKVVEQFERIPDIELNDFDQSDEGDVFYESGSEMIEYEYDINEKGELVLKFTEIDFYTNTNIWYLEKVK